MLIWAGGRVGALHLGNADNSALLSWLRATTLLTAAFFSSSAFAATYYASDDASLRLFMTTANGDGDSSSKIVMTSNFSVGLTSLPPVTKPLTIDANGFTLSSSTGTSITFLGGGSQPVTLLRTFTHDSSVTNAASIVVRGSASVVNNGVIQGGSTPLGSGSMAVELNPLGGGAYFCQ